jgi:quercetin dioxygenase-like cupin family protein
MKSRLGPLALVVAVSVAAGVALAYGVPRIFSAEKASATPSRGFVSTVLARGAVVQDFAFGVPKIVTVKRKISVKTKSGLITRTNPCDTAFQQATIQPGGSSGWHTHPGATFVAVLQGEATIYRATGSDCPSTTLAAGTGFAQMPTELHVVRNEGTVPFVVYTLYILPRGTQNTAIRVDQSQPTACPSIN